LEQQQPLSRKCAPIISRLLFRIFPAFRFFPQMVKKKNYPRKDAPYYPAKTYQNLPKPTKFKHDRPQNLHIVIIGRGNAGGIEMALPDSTERQQKSGPPKQNLKVGRRASQFDRKGGFGWQQVYGWKTQNKPLWLIAPSVGIGFRNILQGIEFGSEGFQEFSFPFLFDDQAPGLLPNPYPIAA